MPRNPSTVIHWPHFQFDHSRDMKLLFAIRVLKSLIHNSTIFFLPLFLFSLGQSIDIAFLPPVSKIQMGFLAVAFFYGFSRLTNVVFGLVQSKMMTIFSPGRALALGMLLFMASTMTLTIVPQFPSLILLASFLFGLHNQFFWVSYSVLFSEHSVVKHVGEDVGIINFGVKFAEMAAPTIGALLIITFGYPSVFFIASCFSFFAILCGWMLGGKPIVVEFSIWRFFEWLKRPNNGSLATALIGRYVNDAVLTLWPLYVFIILGTVEKVGYLHSLSLFISMTLFFIVGFYLDHSNNKKPYFASGGALTALWGVRALMTNPLLLAITDSAHQLFASAHWLMFDVLDIKRAKRDRHVMEYFSYKEIATSFGACIFWVVVGLLFFVFPQWWIVFGLGGIGVVISMRVNE